MFQEECMAIAKCLKYYENIHLDGKETVLKMRGAGSRNWKQMEWIGFFMEEDTYSSLIKNIGGGPGPKYGKTQIDYCRNFPWDIKTHTISDKNDKPKYECILNDSEAIEKSIEEYGKIGFIIYLVDPVWDQDSSFKEWHDVLKGKMSEYVMERIDRGAPSRIRKRGGVIKGIVMFYLDVNSLKQGIEEGWINYFQEGMRNSNGSPRKSKYTVYLGKIPEAYLVPIP